MPSARKDYQWETQRDMYECGKANASENKRRSP